MYIINSAVRKLGDTKSEIADYFPQSIRKYLINVDLCDAYEIHIAVGMPVCIYYPDGRYHISKKGALIKTAAGAVKATSDDIQKCMELITESSVYAVKDDIANGFVTVRGGHRVGIAGSGVIRNGRVSFIKNVSSLNFRLSTERIGAADRLMPYLINGQSVKNALIVSPPAAGKTTMLRDIARQLSDAGRRVAIADERCEIAAMNDGVSAFDLGASCDVLSGIDKARAMMMLLRSMSPEVIITDELGSGEDIAAVKKLLNCGVAVIASVHGNGEKEFYRHFDVIAYLSCRNGAGTVERVDVR